VRTASSLTRGKMVVGRYFSTYMCLRGVVENLEIWGAKMSSSVNAM
jgi:hypothetical protein